MKFKGTFKKVKINLSSYQRELEEFLMDAIAHAALEWLGATAEKIPVWSGASKATFLPLAHAIGAQLIINPVVRPRLSLGLQNADGDITTSELSSGKVSFIYTTTLPHLIWNEFNNANITPDPTKLPDPIKLINPGPYKFQESGKLAFEKFAETLELPGIKKHLSTTTLRVS